MKLFTLGHSNHSLEKFIRLLEDNGVMTLVDVRSAPFSRHNPHFNRESLERELPARQPADIAATLTQQLKKCSGYLRVGLSRGWKKFPGRCFLQVTAIHTFPDYLHGRTFADFRPNRSADSAPAPTG
jgi:hypothetical protein